MKTKDLIKRLQEEDPSGELDVCIDTSNIDDEGFLDIWGIRKECGWYDGYGDGPHQVIDWKEMEVGCHIEKGIYTDTPALILRPMSIKECLWDLPGPDTKVEVRAKDDHKESMDREVAKWRLYGMLMVKHVEKLINATPEEVAKNKERAVKRWGRSFLDFKLKPEEIDGSDSIQGWGSDFHIWHFNQSPFEFQELLDGSITDGWKWEDGHMVIYFSDHYDDEKKVWEKWTKFEPWQRAAMDALGPLKEFKVHHGTVYISGVEK